jgi:hypothetical protein
MIFRPGRSCACLISLTCCTLAVVRSDAGVIDFDTTATPFVVRFGSVPGASQDTWTYSAEASLDAPLQLAAGQAYHVTLHTTPGQAFRLNPATADLEVILYTQNRHSSNGSRPVVATGVGTVRLTGTNVIASPIDLNLRDEVGGTTREGVSLSGPTTYALAKPDPAAQSLVTDFTFDFTMPADFVDPPPPAIPFYLYAVALAGTETVLHGQTGPPIAGFAQVPEPIALAPIALMTMALRRRRTPSSPTA